MQLSNREVLEKANAAVAAGDYEAFIRYCTEDTEWEFTGEQILRGKEAVRQYMAKSYIAPPKFRVAQFISEGNWLTAMGEISLLNDAGAWIDYAYCDVWQFREGKLAKLKAFVVEKKR